MKRIFLFVVTNLAVVLLLGIVARLLGVDRYLYQSGLNLPSLLIFAAIFGMGGSIISLLMSKSIFDAMPKNQQDIILSVGSELEAFGRKGAQDDDVEVAKVYEKAGAKVELK